MLKRCFYLIILGLVLLPCVGLAQSRNNKADKAYQDALTLFRAKKYQEALLMLDKAAVLDSGFAGAYLLQADIYDRMGEDEKELLAIEKGLSLDSLKYTGYYYFLADIYFGRGEYKEARKNFHIYLDRDKKQSNAVLAKKKLQDCEFAIEALRSQKKKPVEIYIRSDKDVYWPSLDITGETVLYTGLTDGDEGIWQRKEGKDAPLLLNTEWNEGTQSLTADGRMMYFTACGRPGSRGSCDIYVSYRISDSLWSEPVNLGEPVNTDAWEAQPAISADGTKLYFASNRPGGRGGSDIWYSTLLKREADGRQIWARPKNLYFNTPGQEMAPFLYFDNKTLFFASDNYPGMGGMDIYKVDLDSVNEPLNVGVTVNTHKNEMGFIVDASGKWGYFASDVNGKRAIFRYQLEERIACDEMAYIRLTVKDEDGELISPDALTVMALSSGDTLAFYDRIYAHHQMLSCVPANNLLLINALKQGYMMYSEALQVGRAGHTHPMEQEIMMKKIRKGTALVLKGVFFDLDAYSLRPESAIELDRLVAFLKQNPEVKIEISGHTDNTGSDQHNYRLSEDRAFEVYKYLFLSRIAKERMTYKGYGKDKPVSSNGTEEGRAENRRTEIIIQ